MLQHSPPRLNERIGEEDLRHRQEPAEPAGHNELVDSIIEVLDTAVDQYGRRIIDGYDASGCVEKEGYGAPGYESVSHSPGENPAREIVDHRLQVRTSSVEKPNHGCIDMPVLVWRRRSNPGFWLGGVDSLSRSSPLVDSDEPAPGGSPADLLGGGIQETGNGEEPGDCEVQQMPQEEREGTAAVPGGSGVSVPLSDPND